MRTERPGEGLSPVPGQKAPDIENSPLYTLSQPTTPKPCPADPIRPTPAGMRSLEGSVPCEPSPLENTLGLFSAFPAQETA